MAVRLLTCKDYKGGNVYQYALLWNVMQYVNLIFMNCDESTYTHTILTDLLMMIIIQGVDPMT